MRIGCPLCGERDSREFHVMGAGEWLARPGPDAGLGAWDAYLHLRENPAGPLRELWLHEAGCGAWLVVERDTLSHAVLAVALAAEAGGAAGPGAGAKAAARGRAGAQGKTGAQGKAAARGGAAAGGKAGRGGRGGA